MPITVDIYASFVYETDDKGVDVYTSVVYQTDDKADDETFKRAENCAVQWCSRQFPPAPSVMTLTRYDRLGIKTAIIRVAAAAAC